MDDFFMAVNTARVNRISEETEKFFQDRMEGNSAEILEIEINIEFQDGLYFVLGYCTTSNKICDTIYSMRVYQEAFGSYIWSNDNVISGKGYNMEDVKRYAHGFFTTISNKIGRILN